jgi:hypothetical protein
VRAPVPQVLAVVAIVAACGTSHKQDPGRLLFPDAGTGDEGNEGDGAARCTPGDGSGGVTQTDVGCELNLFSGTCTVRCSCPEDLCWCNGSQQPVPWGACPSCKSEAGGSLPPFPCNW